MSKHSSPERRAAIVNAYRKLQTCGSLYGKVGEFCLRYGVPRQTLRDWLKADAQNIARAVAHE